MVENECGKSGQSVTCFHLFEALNDALEVQKSSGLLHLIKDTDSK